MNLSHFNHDGLGGSLLSDQQHSLPLLHDGLHQEVRPHVVHVGNQDGRVVWDVVFGVDILWDLQWDNMSQKHVRLIYNHNFLYDVISNEALQRKETEYVEKLFNFETSEWKLSTDLVGPVLPLSLLSDGELKDGLVVLSVRQLQRRAVALQTETNRTC